MKWKGFSKLELDKPFKAVAVTFHLTKNSSICLKVVLGNLPEIYSCQQEIYKRSKVTSAGLVCSFSSVFLLLQGGLCFLKVSHCHGAYFALTDVHLSVCLGNDAAAAHPAFLFLGC